MKIYTKTGDKGETSLFSGKRVYKNNIRIEAYGTLDELNSYLGLLRDQAANQSRSGVLIQIQNNLFNMGAILATEDPESSSFKLPTISNESIEDLEAAMDKMDEALPPLKNFVLPGGHPTVSICHIARTVCRRAERRVIDLHQSSPIAENIIQYLNRLSDYLFVLGRTLAQELKVEEVKWEAKK